MAPKKKKKSSKKQAQPCSTLVPHASKDLCSLLESAKEGKLSAVQQHLAAGGSASAMVQAGEYKMPLLHSVAAQNHPDAVQSVPMLAASCAPDLRDPLGYTALLWAVNSGALPVVKVLHQLGGDIQTANTEGRSALHHSVGNSDTTVLEYLLTNGAAVNACSKSGEPALFTAAQQGNAPAIRLLLQHGANVRYQQRGGKSAILCAVQGGSVEAVELLHAAGGDLKSTAADGSTLLIIAAHCQQLAVAEYLLSKGVAVNACDGGGMAALHWAVSKGDAAKPLVQLLLAHGADVHALAGEGLSTLNQAVISGFPQLAEVLLAAGARPVDGMGYVAFFVAVEKGYASTVELLLKCGFRGIMNDPSPGCSCCGTTTAVMLAPDHSTLKVLLDAGANVHSTTERRNTCLHVAAAHGRSAAVVCQLIKAGVSIRAVNARGQTAAQVAKARGNTLLEALLIRAAKD
jgi:ankyrin repeat protein